jgi:hypothetical protein
MQQRYDELSIRFDMFLNEGGPPQTDEENTEQTYLYYKLNPSSLTRNVTLEEVYKIAWCEACQKAHTPPTHN